MRYDNMDPFVYTNLRVLNRHLPNAAMRGEVTVVPGGQIRGDVSVAIRISGESERDVIITMDMAAALGICSNLLNTKVVSLTPPALDALAELGNIIAGNAVSELNDRGFDFSLNPPVVTVGVDNPAARAGREAVHIPLDSDCGELSVNILLGVD